MTSRNSLPGSSLLNNLYRIAMLCCLFVSTEFVTLFASVAIEVVDVVLERWLNTNGRRIVLAGTNITLNTKATTYTNQLSVYWQSFGGCSTTGDLRSWQWEILTARLISECWYDRWVLASRALPGLCHKKPSEKEKSNCLSARLPVR